MYEFTRIRTITRTTTWIGYIGLIYPSDYGYATSGNSIKNREQCLNKELANWNDSNFKDCIENNWIYTKTGIWTMTPYNNYSIKTADDAFPIYSSGELGYNYSGSFPENIYPTLYLKKNTKIISGNGTEKNPFELNL